MLGFPSHWRTKKKLKNLFVDGLASCSIKIFSKVQLFCEGHKNLHHPPYGFEIYLINVKTIRRMAQTFVAFSEKLNFNIMISRPSFKFFSWHTSLVGLIGTSMMMFFISPIFSAVSILLCLSLVLALNFFSPVRNANWGSISQALLFHQVSFKKM